MSKKLNRRDFIKNTTTVGIATIASGITLTTFATKDTPVTNENRWGLLIDINKLTESNIEDMVNACQEENGWGNEKHSTGDQKPSWIKKIKVRDKSTGKIDVLPMMCQHCEHPLVWMYAQQMLQ